MFCTNFELADGVENLAEMKVISWVSERGFIIGGPKWAL